MGDADSPAEDDGGGGGGFSQEIIEYAREQAKGAKNPERYKNAILERIRQAGLKTLAEVQEADKQHKADKKTKRPANQLPERIGGETIV